ncbi:MAG TPA: response regulator, partial [Ktedonobacterales bacterium]
MPEVDGFALLESIRSNPHTASLPVILLSARAGEEATLEGLRAGADDYLVKPFSAREVLSRVAARLEMARLRNEAHEHAERLRAILDLLPVGVAFVDAQGKAVIVNRQVKAIWGESLYLAESHADFGRYKAWWPETGKRVAAEEWGIAHALATGESSSGVELDIEAFAGARKTILSSDAPLRDETGAIAGAMSVIVDITERKRLERQTREALEALLELAASMVSDPAEDSGIPQETALGIAPRTGSVVYRFATLCSRVLACERIAIIAVEPGTELLRTVAITGSSSEQEQQFRTSFSVMRLADRFDAQTHTQLLSGETVLIDVDRLSEDDPARVLSRRFFLIAPMVATGALYGYIGVNFGDEAGHYTAQNRALALAVAQLVGMVMERDRLTRERTEAQATALALREASRRMDEFLGIASHELRTPLTSVMANVQMGERIATALHETTVPEALAVRLEQQH